MGAYIAVFHSYADGKDKLFNIEAYDLDNAHDKAEALYIVMNGGDYELMLVDTAEVVNSL